jgi:hypothetical protein
MQKQIPRHFWPPLYAGIGLGLTLLSMFLISGHGLGASGFFKRLDTQLSIWLAPAWSQNNGLFHTLLTGGHPLDNWISWQIIGVALGAFVASFLSGRFQFQIERGAKISINRRLAFAFIGGLLAGFGAALASGCTSGLGLSGGATLAVAAFLFLGAFFISGIVVSRWTRRIW